MRQKRVRKYKRVSQRIILGAQLLTIWYVLIFSMGYLTSETMASFSSSSEITVKVKAGEWWDGSKLAFIGKGNQNEKVCPSTEISVKIQNTGFTMIGSTTYEVYYIENGNPKNGKLVKEGVLEPLEKDEIISLSHIAEQEGFYMFKAYQREGYIGKKEVIWSEKVKVKCKENTEENGESEQNDKQIELKINEEMISEKQEDNLLEESEKEKVKKEVQQDNSNSDEIENEQSTKGNEIIPEPSNEGSKLTVVEEQNKETKKEDTASKQLTEGTSPVSEANQEPSQEGEEQ